MNTNKQLSAFLVLEIKAAEFERTISELPADAGLFFQLAAVNKLGVNPMTTYDTPIGIYSYPFSSEYKEKLLTGRLPFAGHQPYIHFFRAKSGSKSFNIQEYSNYEQDKQKLKVWFDSQESFKNSTKELHAKLSLIARSFRKKFLSTHGMGSGYVVDVLRDLPLDNMELFNSRSKEQLENFLAQELKSLGLKNKTVENIYNILNDKFKTYIFEPNETTNVDDIIESVSHVVADLFIDFLEEYPNLNGETNFDELAKNAESESRQQTPAGFLWNVTRNIAILETEQRKEKTSLSASENPPKKNEIRAEHRSSVVWTFILSKVLGYDYAFDEGNSGLIHPHEPTQAVFFNAKIIEFLETVFNAKTTETDPSLSREREFSRINPTTTAIPKPPHKNQSIEKFLKTLQPVYKQLTNNANFTLEGLINLISSNQNSEQIKQFFSDYRMFYVLSLIPHKASELEKQMFFSYFGKYDFHTLLQFLFPGMRAAKSVTNKFSNQYVTEILSLLNNTAESFINKNLETSNEDKQFKITQDLFDTLPFVQNEQIRAFLINLGDRFVIPAKNIDSFFSGNENASDDFGQYVFNYVWKVMKKLRAKSSQDVITAKKLAKEQVSKYVLKYAIANKKPLDPFVLNAIKFNVDSLDYKNYKEVMKTLPVEQ